MPSRESSESHRPAKPAKRQSSVLVVELDPQSEGDQPDGAASREYDYAPDYGAPDFGDEDDYDDAYGDGYDDGYDAAYREWEGQYAVPYQPARYQWDPAQEQRQALPPPVDEQPVPVWPHQPPWILTPAGAVLAFLFGPCLVQLPLQFCFAVYLMAAGLTWSRMETGVVGFGLAGFVATVLFWVLYFRAYLRQQPWVPLWDVSGWLITREVQGVRWVMARRPVGRIGWIPAEQWEWLPRQEWERREAARAAGAAASLFIALGLLYLTTRPWGRRW